MIVDSNIFIDFLKDRSSARKFFETTSGLSTSIVVVMELIVGLDKKSRVADLERFLDSAEITVYPLTQDISHYAYRLLSDYHHPSGIGIADALIAGTAQVYGQQLATLNEKHFKDIQELSVVNPYLNN